MKNFRFSLLTILLSLSLVVFNTGCDSDDSGTNSTNPLVGTWDLSTVAVNQAGQTITIPVSTFGIAASIVTNSDGTFTSTATADGDTETASGTWTSTTTSITLTSNGQSYTLPYSLNGNVMTIQGSDDTTEFIGFEVEYITFTKR